jgi:hypothetical protein
LMISWTLFQTWWEFNKSDFLVSHMPQIPWNACLIECSWPKSCSVPSVR